jgi:hypothetical protein
MKGKPDATYTLNKTPSTKVPTRLLTNNDFDEMADTLSNLLQDDLGEFFDEDQLTDLGNRIIHTLMGNKTFEIVDFEILEKKLVSQAALIQELKEQLAKPMTMNEFKNRAYNQINGNGHHLQEKKGNKSYVKK